MTNYLLPWIALTAQLPYENGTPWDTLMSFCLSLGSPALITYSLMITLLNRIWIYTKFKSLIKRTRHNRLEDRYRAYGRRIEALFYLLSESQQVPLRTTQTEFWLSSLVVSPLNQQWWENLQERLQRSRRGFTFSLFAQILLAGFVWMFTIISAILAAWGNSTTALQIAAATLWTWLVRCVFIPTTVSCNSRLTMFRFLLHTDGLPWEHRIIAGQSNTLYWRRGRIESSHAQPNLDTASWRLKVPYWSSLVLRVNRSGARQPCKTP